MVVGGGGGGGGGRSFGGLRGVFPRCGASVSFCVRAVPSRAAPLRYVTFFWESQSAVRGAQIACVCVLQVAFPWFFRTLPANSSLGVTPPPPFSGPP